MRKANNFYLGIFLGLLAPFIGIIAFYLWKASSTPFGYFLFVMVENKTFLTAAISLALILNVLVFSFFANTNRIKTAKGIFLMTLIITIPALVYKLFF